ncbi:hypothetical protein SNL152K_3916 [Streptomyces sp. NL15-2K]|nr:hypothetical protein SNL152K_3916 [Streptomyces sp. NL15-2K]
MTLRGLRYPPSCRHLSRILHRRAVSDAMLLTRSGTSLTLPLVGLGGCAP